MNALVSAGRISKLFGIGGGVLLNLYDTFPEDINMEEPLFVRIDSLTVPLFFDRFERRGRRGAFARFADFDTEVRATELLGLEFSILPQRGQAKGGNRHDDADDDSGDVIFLEDLVGYTALFEGYDHRGRIARFVDDDHNPLFDIDIDGVSALVPAADEFIVSFDPAAREILFSIPAGLLELYI